MSEVEQVARWATADLRPHLTVLLDVDPTSGLGRFDEQDRIEAESVSFHERVRVSFQALAQADPEHYLIVDAHLDREAIAGQVRERLATVLPLAERHSRVRP